MVFQVKRSLKLLINMWKNFRLHPNLFSIRGHKWPIYREEREKLKEGNFLWKSLPNISTNLGGFMPFPPNGCLYKKNIFSFQQKDGIVKWMGIMASVTENVSISVTDGKTTGKWWERRTHQFCYGTNKYTISKGKVEWVVFLVVESV